MLMDEKINGDDRQVITHRVGKCLDLLFHSMLGLIVIYNLLPQYVVIAKNVSDFQRRLQLLVCEMASSAQNGWGELYSPRNPIWNNKLRSMYDWCPAGVTYHPGGECSMNHNSKRNERMFAF